MNDTLRRRLPEELLIIVVEQTSDRRTLLSMMLVCRSMHRYAERVCFEVFFASRGLGWIFDALRPGCPPGRNQGGRALELLERASRYCRPRELPAIEVGDLSLPCFTPQNSIPADEFMVGRQTFKGRISLLQLAALSNHVEIVEFLIRGGVDVNATPEILHHPGGSDLELSQATPLLLATTANSVEVAQLLLEQGADIGRSWVALLQCGSGELVSMFLKKHPGLLHIPVDTGSGNGDRSPLIFALECNVRDPSSVVDVLIAHGANTAWIEHVYRLRGSCVGWALERGWLGLALFFAKTYGRQQDAYDAFRVEGEVDEEILGKRIGIVEALIGRDVQVMPGWKSYFALPLAYSV
ncbi:hypothetical protein CMUS01_15077 [Colletotrichum musicola]|uniref:Ankyrin n=1 Tax=Colletotrichum musicola TaxID=2175873 RepID=A0A8H6IZQ8_9PEZI|nr:hypothetical protein CMUS01_15077 [Colletotrichum musicola]